MTAKLAKMPINSDEQSMLRLENQLCFQIYSASRAMTQTYRPLLTAIGLTYPQYLVMLVLWEKQSEFAAGEARAGETFASSSVSELGMHLRLDSGTLSPLLKRLEAQGLLLRQRNVKDERQVEVVLTEQGLALSEKAAEIPGKLLCDLDMPKVELKGLKKQLERLLDMMNSMSH